MNSPITEGLSRTDDRNLVGFGVGCAIVAVVALYTIFLLQVQTSDGHLSPGENQDLEVADVLGDLETFLSTKSSGPTSEVLRKTRLYEFLEHTSENRLAALLRQSEDIEDSTWRNTIQSSTLRRLTAINPLKALNLSSSYPKRTTKMVGRDRLQRVVSHGLVRCRDRRNQASRRRS